MKLLIHLLAKREVTLRIGNKHQRSVFLRLCLGLAILEFNAVAGAAQERLYVDQTRYFAAVPSGEWRLQEYAEERIRSKVEWHHPQESAVIIRVIAAPISNPAQTFEEFYSARERKDAEFKRLFPTARSTVKKSRLGNRNAALWSASMPGNDQEVLLVFDKGFEYSLSYSAPDREALQRHRRYFDSFLENFVPLEHGRQFSEEQILQSRVAAKKSLAKGAEELGDRALALRFVDEGLAIDPGNQDLKQMARRLRLRQQTTPR